MLTLCQCCVQLLLLFVQNCCDYVYYSFKNRDSAFSLIFVFILEKREPPEFMFKDFHEVSTVGIDIL